MFEHLEPAPPDSIFGLNDLYLRDPHPQKINLTVGVYQDESGKTPILQSVQEAGARLAQRETTKDYLAMGGLAEYNSAVAELVLGRELASSDRVVALQTLGGTGALRLSADLLARSLGHTRIWHSDPTWANHTGIFRAAGLTPVAYRYVQARGTQLDFTGMMDDLQRIPLESALLVHAVCHNPTGFDLNRAQWEQLAELVRERRLVTVFDFAYQGWGDSLERDAWPIRHFCSLDLPLFVCSSFSKNMGLYGERMGCCLFMGPTAAAGQSVLSHLKLHARCSYSNPVRHGAYLAATVLNSPDLRVQWENELNGMRMRLRQLRELWLEAMREFSPHLDFDFVLQQRGMFSYSGLDAQQIQTLREKYSIYALSNGRVNIAGIRPNNVERLCTAIAEVCGQLAHSRSDG